MTSPATPKASRLVARIRRRGQESRRASTSRAAASTRCSQLSSTSSVSLLAQGVDERIGERLAGLFAYPQSPATAWAPAPVGERRQLHQPHPVRVGPNESLATSRARRVLPEPPAPSGSRAASWRALALTSTISRSRPTKLVLGAGRLCLAGARWLLGWGADGTQHRVGGNRPAAISSLRARLEAAGSVPSSLERTSSSRSYWASASPLLPERAYRRIRPACASSRVGLLRHDLPQRLDGRPDSPRSSWRRASSEQEREVRLPQLLGACPPPTPRSGPRAGAPQRTGRGPPRRRRAHASGGPLLAASSKASTSTHRTPPGHSTSDSSWDAR